ncbi:DUF3310 domain-containing protein [Selenomonas sp.]|uniref:DUF3310 domain-containing protein n=1 Tax=Selenomonas sp. TaxID=2053611 RepID=UPI0025F4BA92|nr:DUF3310 domain-containing protein [Selenomonas sp.]MCI6283451.1 DUF3310 domain-containing protein [Selenomonas sp.]
METKRQENPGRYARLSPQPIEYMRQIMNKGEFRGFCIGNILKYACRIGYKDTVGGNAQKIEDYARWLGENEQGKPLTWKDTKDEPEFYGLTAEERKTVDGMVQKMMGREERSEADGT